MKNRILSGILSLCMVLSLVLVPAQAAESASVTLDIKDGNITISATGYAVGTAAETAYTGPYVLTGTSTENTVTVAGGTHSITLQDLSIQQPAQSELDYSPFSIEDGASVTLVLVGENTLSGGLLEAGLRVPSGASLTVAAESTGALSAKGGLHGAGIGGRQGESAGTVTIHGGTLQCTGGIGAGIGGGAGKNANAIASGDGGTVIITGGHVTAHSVMNGIGAGIGGGGDYDPNVGGEKQGGAAGTIEIRGGYVNACGNPGIGAGNYATGGGTISLTGGLIIARGEKGSAAVGAGNGSSVTIPFTPENCILWQGDEGLVYGTASLPCDYELPQGATLTVPAGATLDIPAGVTLYNPYAAVQNDGAITGTGTLYGEVLGAPPAGTVHHQNTIPTVDVSTEAELRAAVVRGVWNIRLTGDIALAGRLDLGGTGVIDGNGHTLSMAGNNQYDTIRYVSGNDSSLFIQNLTIVGNSSSDLALSSSSNVTLENCLITGGTHYGFAGSGNTTVNNCTIYGLSNDGSMTVNDCLITRNRSDSWSGIYNRGSLYLNRSIVTGNVQKNRRPGGIDNSGSLSVSNSIVAGNYAILSGELTPSDLRSSKNDVMVINSIVGAVTNSSGEPVTPDVVVDSSVDANTALSEIFANLETVNVAGASVSVPVVNDVQRGAAAVALTEPAAAYLAAAPKVMLSVKGYQGAYTDYDDHGVSVVSSVPHTAYFGNEKLTTENYLTAGYCNYPDISGIINLHDVGRKTVYYYILRDGLAPVAGSAEIVVTKAVRKPVDVSKVTFDAKTMTVTDTTSDMKDLQYSVDSGASWHFCAEDHGHTSVPISGVTAEHGILLRRPGDQNNYPSEPAAVAVGQQAKPDRVTLTQPEASGATGTISGVTAAMEYSDDDGATWTACTSSPINGTQGKTYLIRTKAAGNCLPSEPLAFSVNVVGKSTEPTPAAAIDYGAETLTNLSGDYLICGAPYTASGSVPIQASWFDATAEIIKRGNGRSSNDSAAQQLPIPARPGAPAVTATEETYPGAKDGGLSTTNAMEYSTDRISWTPCGGPLSGLAAGTYYVRNAATDRQFASAIAAVLVGSKPAAPEATPAAAVSADSDYLESLTANAVYMIGGTAYTADEAGKIPVQRAWRGATLQIIKRGNGVSTADSAAQYLTVPGLTVTYTVTYSMNGGFGSITDNSRYATGDTVPVKFTPAPQMAGVSFLGWATSADAADALYTPDGMTTFDMGESDVTLYAVWGPAPVDITWVVDGNRKTVKVAQGKIPAFSGTPVKAPTDTEEFTFTGWQPTPVAAEAPATYTAQFAASPRSYAVTLNANGGAVNAGAVESYTCGTGAALPTDVTKNGYLFGGWYENSDFLGSPVTAIPADATGDKTFYAKWESKSSGSVSGGSTGNSSKPSANATTTTKNPDGSTTTTKTDKSTGAVTETTKWPDGTELQIVTQKSGAQDIAVTVPENKDKATIKIPAKDLTPGTVAAIVRPDGTEEVVKRSVAVEGGLLVTLDASAELKLIENTKHFGDVAKNAWYGDSVVFAASRELFYGTSETTFSPEQPMTRAMLITVLARLDGQDTEGGEHWYSKALAWAKAQDISDGSQPEDSITREQLAAMLYRYAGSPATAGTLDGFADAAQAGRYAVDALRWAVEQKIITGTGGGALAPKDTATRAEVAAMLMRYLSSISE